MLTIEIPAGELWDPKYGNGEGKRPGRFVKVKSTTLNLEHSLVSISKWESKWHKPFLAKGTKTNEETLDYIKCMTLTQNVDPNVYKCLTADNINDISDYIEDPYTATTINEHGNKPKKKEVFTSEVIYYMMIAYNIPVEFQKWHLNRLITLIRVCEIKNSKPEKRGKEEIISDYARMNEAARKKYNSKG